MKKQQRSKLVVRTETVRALTKLDLAQAAGGAPTTTVIPSKIICPLAND